MRITNKMLTNSMMNNINKNKNSVNKYEEQYTTGKKIQRPSDDPIIAVRALKLRSTITELNQYLEKNIPDALSWMDVSESGLKNINSILTNINTYCNQGANDPLSVSDRNTIVENLEQFKAQIYKEMNANYAGRYVYSGYKTNNPITFDTTFQDTKYEITEKFSGEDIQQISKVIGGYTSADYDSANPDKNAFAQAPTLLENIYRLRLSYDKLDDKTITTDDIKFTKTTTSTDADGNEVVTKQKLPISELGVTVKNKVSTDSDAYQPAENEIIYLKDSGELVFGSAVYDKLRLQGEEGISVDYQKTNFSVGDCKPEHFFDCVATDKYGNVKEYHKSEQDINYEVNFNQVLKINTQMSQVMGTAVGRDIDDILETVRNVQDVENQITNVDKLLSNVDISTEQEEALKLLKEQLSTELVLKSKLMTDAFESGIGRSLAYQSDINIAIADLGSRYSRLELTQSRLEDQQIEYTELLSENEDADLVDAYINLSASENIYTASLNAVSKITKNSLLDFI